MNRYLKYYFNFHVCLSMVVRGPWSVVVRGGPWWSVIPPAQKMLYFRVSVTLAWSGPYAPPEELDSTRVAGTF